MNRRNRHRLINGLPPKKMKELSKPRVEEKPVQVETNTSTFSVGEAVDWYISHISQTRWDIVHDAMNRFYESYSKKLEEEALAETINKALDNNPPVYVCQTAACDSTYAGQIVTINCNTKISRNEIFELGQRKPYFRFIEFPVEITEEIKSEHLCTKTWPKDDSKPS